MTSGMLVCAWTCVIALVSRVLHSNSLDSCLGPPPSSLGTVHPGLRFSSDWFMINSRRKKNSPQRNSTVKTFLYYDEALLRRNLRSIFVYNCEFYLIGSSLTRRVDFRKNVRFSIQKIYILHNEIHVPFNEDCLLVRW